MKLATFILVVCFVGLTAASASESCEEKLQELRPLLAEAGGTIKSLRDDVANQKTALALAVDAKKDLVAKDGLKTTAFNKMSTAYAHVLEEYAAEVETATTRLLIIIGMSLAIAIYIGLKIYPATRMFIP